MEAFTLLKYWRSGVTSGDTASKTIVAAPSAAASAVSPYSSDGEDGPYFDLEFALPDAEGKQQKVEESENGEETEESDSDVEEMSVQDDDEDGEENGEVKFTIAGDDCTEPNAAVSPSDELFFKGDLVSIEPSSILLNGSEESSKIPVFLLKSATKFRVLLLKLKKSKLGDGEKAEKPEEGKENPGMVNGKLFAVKLKVEEAPFVSLFTRDSSSKEIHGGKLQQKSGLEDSGTNEPLEEKKLSKEVVQKYLKMVKPFYIRVSKRYAERLKFSGHPGGGSKGAAAVPGPPENGGEPPAETAPKIQAKQGSNLQAGLKVVCKRLGKSRSASAAAAALPPQTASNRRDDSLLQVQDGIQGAILHCKRSFNASRDEQSSSSSLSSSSSSSSILWRSVSDPSYEKSVKAEEKRGIK